MDDRVEHLLRRTARRAGKVYAETRRAYREGRGDGDADADTGGDGDGADRYGLPTDADGAARIVCRRHVDRRAVRVAGDGRPACFEAGHPDCEGCLEDVREGVVETW
jgi:hypothetical protein